MSDDKKQSMQIGRITHISNRPPIDDDVLIDEYIPLMPKASIEMELFSRGTMSAKDAKIARLEVVIAKIKAATEQGGNYKLATIEQIIEEYEALEDGDE